MHKYAWLLSVLFAAGWFGCDRAKPSADGARPVTLALNWVPEPEFGGIYAAREIGAFSRHKLDVRIQPGGAGAATWQLVAAGKATFAVAGADEVLLARSRGADIVAVFATFQTSPQGIMVHASRGLRALDEVFAGGTLAIEPGLPYAAYLKEKYGFGRMKVVAYDGDIRPFLADERMATQCFVTSEPISARRQGARPQIFLVADAGYNPYTAVVITSGATARNNPHLVKSMVLALREGWRSYLDNPSPVNEVMQKLNGAMDLAAFAAAAEAQRPLIESEHTSRLGLGSMTVERWDTLGRQLAALKLLDVAPPARECFIE